MKIGSRAQGGLKPAERSIPFDNMSVRFDVREGGGDSSHENPSHESLEKKGSRTEGFLFDEFLFNNMSVPF